MPVSELPKNCLLCFATLFLALACNGEAPETSGAQGAEADEARTPVVAVTIDRHEFSDRIEAVGTARAKESVVITAQVTDTVVTVNFEDGQTVEAGDLLVGLTSAEESAQLAEAHANYTEAKRQHARVEELFAGASESRARLDEQLAARDAARARLRELEARLADRLIRAPFGGILGLRGVSPGTLLRPGDPITTLDDIDVIKLDFTVPESFLSALQTGLEVQAASTAYPGQSFAGIVTGVDTRIHPRTRAVTVRAELPNQGHRLRPGMLLTVDLETRRTLSPAVPEQALMSLAEQQFVVLVEQEDRARRVEVAIGRRLPGLIEILSGVAAGDRVIVEGVDRTRSGELVRLVEPPPQPGA
ncbi:MAG: efflux RND transporter periplasmic adaptor subunit [Deltaproteobacteria bacterium]|nr:efflux RND transporter periplasmic adaptor subunit [Deltaproteobacteria bacterium]MBW2361519.1 efflux RND transporter periplasmic adaptor subunit [Deltaproteobacteria bacterium]